MATARAGLDKTIVYSALRRLALAATSLASLATAMPAAQASSHREAPMIAGMPRLDASDFYMFRSYETGRSGYVTMVANYLPLQDPAGGPNFFDLETNGYYDINVDTNGSGKPTFAYRFRFKNLRKDLALNVNGTAVPIALVNEGPISTSSSANQNTYQVYTVSLVLFDANGNATNETKLQMSNGKVDLLKPMDNIGDKSIPNYAEYANSFIYNLQIPGCGTGRVFVGQRKDPFVINLGETFDLINYAHPVGEQFKASALDDLAAKNVTSFVWEVPAACLTNTGDSVVGAYTTSSMKLPNGTYTQVSRIGNPLVNELVIGLKDKDKFNASLPANDTQFATYITNPTIPLLIQALFSSAGVKAPTKFPRADLVAVFATGIAGLNQPRGGGGVIAEEMRLNTMTPVTAYGAQNRLGVIGGDNAGYPNGRRPGDDIVDITIRVAMGKLYSLGLYGSPSDAPSGSLEFTDGAYTDSTHYLQTFPYLMPPVSSSPQSAGTVPVPTHEPK